MNRPGVVALVLLATACTAEPPPPTGASAQPIIGGAPSPGDSAVVMLASYPPDRSVLATCTAVVIAPTVLATAAHCVDALNHPGWLFGAFPGPDASIYPRLVDLEPHLVPITEVHAHPAYDPAPPFHADLGVAILSQPLTGVTPVRIYRGLLAPLVGGPARIVGYGQETVGQFSTVRRAATTVVAQIDQGDTVTVGDIDHRTCVGDSGGPALVEVGGVEQLLGIDSYGPADCGQPGHFIRADLYQPFLDGYSGDQPPAVDAGVEPDAGMAGDDEGGCATGGSGGAGGALLGLALLALRRRPVARRSLVHYR